MTALLDHLWQSTLFALPLGALTLLLRRHAASVRFWVWFTASVKFLVPFSLLMAAGGSVTVPVAPVLQGGPTLGMLQDTAAPFTNTPAASIVPNTTTDWTLVLIAIWAAGTCLALLIWGMRWLKLRALVRAARPLAIPAALPIMTSSASLEPGLIGIFRPVLMLPDGIQTRLSRQEIDAILAHELCHFRRRDNLTAAVHMLVESLFWFHPLVWWLGRRLMAERENACDEAVLAAGTDPRVYAEGILKVCKFYMQSPLYCAAGVSGADLKKRIEAILRSKIFSRLTLLHKSVLALCAAIVIVAPMTLGMLTAPPFIEPALALVAHRPHPGTEAALRHQIESMERGRADFGQMTQSLAEYERIQSPYNQATIKKWGALRSIAFVGNEGPFDVYRAAFENEQTVWRIAPLGADGKIIGLLFGVAARDGNGPSPGLAAAVRRELEGEWTGKLPFEIMTPEMQTSMKRSWPGIAKVAKDLGAVQSVTFQQVSLAGWDEYHVTFANGTATAAAPPLTDGKLRRLFRLHIILPNRPQRPGTEAFLRRHIASLQKGQPNYDEMQPGPASIVKRELPALVALLKDYGALKSITFKGGSVLGMDAYEVTFEHATVPGYVAPLDADGKVANLGFH